MIFLIVPLLWKYSSFIRSIGTSFKYDQQHVLFFVLSLTKYPECLLLLTLNSCPSVIHHRLGNGARVVTGSISDVILRHLSLKDHFPNFRWRRIKVWLKSMVLVVIQRIWRQKVGAVLLKIRQLMLHFSSLEEDIKRESCFWLSIFVGLRCFSHLLWFIPST